MVVDIDLFSFWSDYCFCVVLFSVSEQAHWTLVACNSSERAKVSLHGSFWISTKAVCLQCCFGYYMAGAIWNCWHLGAHSVDTMHQIVVPFKVTYVAQVGNVSFVVLYSHRGRTLFPGPKVQGQGDFGSMDIASVGDTSDSHNMDSEDLVPSLQVCTTHSHAVTASPAPPPSQHASGVARSLHMYSTAPVT